MPEQVCDIKVTLKCFTHLKPNIITPNKERKFGSHRNVIRGITLNSFLDNIVRKQGLDNAVVPGKTLRARKAEKDQGLHEQSQPAYARQRD